MGSSPSISGALHHLRWITDSESIARLKAQPSPPAFHPHLSHLNQKFRNRRQRLGCARASPGPCTGLWLRAARFQLCKEKTKMLEENWLWKKSPGNKHPLAFRSHKNNKYSIPELAGARASLMLLARWHRPGEHPQLLELVLPHPRRAAAPGGCCKAWVQDLAPQPQQGTPVVKPLWVPGSSRHRRDVSSPSTTEGSRRRERSEKSARWISSCNCADLEKQLKGLLFPYYCEAFLAAILLWFGRYPSAGIILVKGYIAAEHSFGAGTVSAPGSPSHHARAAGCTTAPLFPFPISHAPWSSPLWCYCGCNSGEFSWESQGLCYQHQGAVPHCLALRRTGDI